MSAASASGPVRSTPVGPFLLRAPRTLFAVAMLAAGLVACSTLPNVREAMARPHARQVQFEGSRGEVSPARSDAILERLGGSAGGTDLLDRHLAYEQSLNAGSPLVLGNHATLLQNGPETYASMHAAIRAARDHINLETYIFDDGDVGGGFADLLLERQAAGVQVNVIHDGFGSIATPATFFERMRAGGIRVLEFNPVNPLADGDPAWRLNHRDHRKLLIVDGRVAFIGGINISDSYASSPSGGGRGRDGARKPAGWRDTHVRVEGPVVAEFQTLFLQTWASQHAEALPARDYHPELAAVGDQIVRAIGSGPDERDSLIYLTLMSAISHAEREVQLTVAYFAPDRQLLDALAAAAARGVKVSLVLPSHSDSWPVFHLGRSHYSELLRNGVLIHERRGALMHAKTACIDGVWSTIGSTNLDWRSFLHNDEINAVILGRGFAAQMETMFAADVAASEQILRERWRRRPLLQRVKERLARVIAYWL